MALTILFFCLWSRLPYTVCFAAVCGQPLELVAPRALGDEQQGADCVRCCVFQYQWLCVGKFWNLVQTRTAAQPRPFFCLSGMLGHESHVLRRPSD